MTAESTLEFVDTNVLLYAYDRSAGARHDAAARLVGELGARRRGAISIQVLQEFYVNATRKIAVPLGGDAALDRVRILSRWPLHIPHAPDVVDAIELAQTSQLSFWDAMIVRSASVLGCSLLWSEDLNDGQQISGVTVRNPFSGTPHREG